MSRYVAPGADHAAVDPGDLTAGDRRSLRKRSARGRQRGRGRGEQAADREFARAVAAQDRDAGVSISDRAESEPVFEALEHKRQQDLERAKGLAELRSAQRSPRRTWDAARTAWRIGRAG